MLELHRDLPDDCGDGAVTRPLVATLWAAMVVASLAAGLPHGRATETPTTGNGPRIMTVAPAAMHAVVQP